jgi:hypothetical protein
MRLFAKGRSWALPAVDENRTEIQYVFEIKLLAPIAKTEQKRYKKLQETGRHGHI